jgi:predicted dehydrogenase
MINLAIVGTGGMANTHAQSFSQIPGCRITAVCDVVEQRAADFAARHKLPAGAACADLKQLLAKAPCDAVSVVTGDAGHAPVTLACLAAGKHVLCEKPLATNYADARKMAAAAAKAGRINMTNFSYRNSSAIHAAAKLVREGAIGRVIHFEACYLQSWLASPYWGDWRKGSTWLWRLSRKAGSKGVLGDVGVHILDFATYPAGEIASVFCRLKAFPKAPGNKLHGVKFDANDSAILAVELKNGALGVIHTSRWATGYKNQVWLQIHGDRGAIKIDLDKSWEEIQICRGKDVKTVQWKTLRTGKTPNIYQRFIKSIQTGKNGQPDFARGAAIQKVIDACFESDAAGRPVKV